MEEKRTITTSDKDSAISMLLQFINVCPQIIKPGIGLEAFVEDLNKAALKFAEYNPPNIQKG